MPRGPTIADTTHNKSKDRFMEIPHYILSHAVINKQIQIIANSIKLKYTFNQK